MDKTKILRGPQPAPCPPGDKFGHRQHLNFCGRLFDHQVIHGQEKTGLETYLRKTQEDAVHADGIFVFQPAQIRHLQAGAVSHDETALTPVFVL
jgi:hypothetical protein